MPHEPSTLHDWTWTRPPTEGERAGLTFTVLYHPDPDRIGEMAALPFERGRGPHIDRTSPEFCCQGGPVRPLGDPYMSRSPLQFVQRGGRVAVEVSDPRVRYLVDGVAQAGTLPPELAERGCTLTLGRRVLVRVEAGVRPPARRSTWGLLGVSPATEALRDEILRAASGAAPVLIRGETGTGKELVAAALHATSERRAGPYLAVNLAAIPAPTAAAQLFGHMRGAFTGATHDQPGLFGAAEGGTLLLDEIGEAPEEVQPLLLRALDRCEVQPVGGSPRRCDVRVLAATDADLEALVAADRFRRPLLYRLAARTLSLRPLRARPADIAVQLVEFLRLALREAGAEPRLTPPRDQERPWLGMDVMTACLAAPWPGNSRELRAEAGRMAVDAALDESIPPASTRRTDEPPEVELGEEALRRALVEHRWEVRATARALSVAPNTVYARLRQLGLPTAGELDAQTILEARARTGGEEEAMAAALQVSESGLRRRMKVLGLR